MRFSNRVRAGLLTFIFAITSSAALAHQGHRHAHPGSQAKTPMSRKEGDSALRLIREDYKRRVELVFQKTCMDCHSSQTRYPWYYKIPGIRQRIESDIREARHHLDFSDGYPFKSHATPTEDLDAISESIQRGTMPPFSYRIMHQKDGMTDEERKTVLDWVRQSKARMEQVP